MIIAHHYCFKLLRAIKKRHQQKKESALVIVEGQLYSIVVHTTKRTCKRIENSHQTSKILHQRLSRGKVLPNLL
jgi:hypothetical protein